jgi:hypothetical protein
MKSNEGKGFIQTEEYYDPTINGLKIICFHLKMELPSFLWILLIVKNGI